MVLRYDEPGKEVTVVGQWEGGLTWIAHPDETMRRASHALVIGDTDDNDDRRSAGNRTESDEEVWLIDPLDVSGLDEELDSLGTVAGVVVLTNSHGRDADLFAARYDVAIHVPACFSDAAEGFEAPVEFIEDELADTGFELVWEKDGAGWKEGALYHPERRTLVVPDALSTALFTREDGRLEVFPLFRLSPPRDDLGELRVERVLVGHGEPVVENAQAALDDALAASRRGAVSAICVRFLPTFSRIVYNEIRR